jgi:hypothetical protein
MGRIEGPSQSLSLGRYYSTWGGRRGCSILRILKNAYLSRNGFIGRLADLGRCLGRHITFSSTLRKRCLTQLTGSLERPLAYTEYSIGSSLESSIRQVNILSPISHVLDGLACIGDTGKTEMNFRMSNAGSESFWLVRVFNGGSLLPANLGKIARSKIRRRILFYLVAASVANPQLHSVKPERSISDKAVKVVIANQEHWREDGYGVASSSGGLGPAGERRFHQAPAAAA